MKPIIACFLIIASVSTGMTRGQTDGNNTPQMLSKLYDRLIINFNDNDRLRINDSIKLLIDSYVKSDTLFNHKFSNLRYLGQITSPDSMLKIITWNLVLRSSASRYFCYFIRKSEQGKENSVCSLTALYKPAPIRTDTVYSESDWYGALYY